MEKLWKNYGTMEKNYGTMEKNYGTIPKSKELRFMKWKHMIDYQKKLWFIMEKTMVIYKNNWSFWTNI